jgi:hypothetical protein
MGCHFYPLHERLFKEVGNGGFGPGDGLIGIPGGSLDVEERSIIELRRRLFFEHEKAADVVGGSALRLGLWHMVLC